MPNAEHKAIFIGLGSLKRALDVTLCSFKIPYNNKRIATNTGSGVKTRFITKTRCGNTLCAGNWVLH